MMLTITKNQEIFKSAETHQRQEILIKKTEINKNSEEKYENFYQESQCRDVLQCCWNPNIPIACFKPVTGKSGLTPGGAAGITIFVMFVIFVPLVWFLFLRN